MKVPLSSPDITEQEINEVLGVLKTPYLSLGPKHKEFEKEFSGYIGTRFASAVSSGTAGLHLSVKVIGVGENDGVITTPFSFIASSNVILFEKAVPFFVDIDPKTLNLDPLKVQEFIETQCDFDGEKLIHKKSRRNIKAILLVHIFGHPADMDRFLELAQKYNLKIIEDACEAIGAEYKGKKVGTFGELAVFAFYPNKQMTTGEGGMVVTDNENYDKLVKSLRNQGRGEAGLWLEHVRLGYNYRMDELSAALGLVQIRRIDEILKKRERVASIYNELLQEIEEVELPYIAPYAKLSWWVYIIKVKENLRDNLMQFLYDSGIGVRPYFPPIHLQKFYREKFGYKGGEYPITEQVSKQSISIPFFNKLKEEQIKYVVTKIKEGLTKFK